MTTTEIDFALQKNPAMGSYTWAFPGSPIRISLSLNFVQMLTPEFKNRVPAGGILIGRVISPLNLEITEFWPIPSGESDECAGTSSGQSYVLAPEHWDQVEHLKAELSSHDDGKVALGYYRTQSNHGLYLNDDDLALLRKHFSKPTDVCLLIRPLEDGSATAGFFFWENGVIESGFSFNEFPFDVERLRIDAQEQQRTASAQALAQTAEEAEPAEYHSSASAETGERKKPARMAPESRPMLITACLVLILVGGFYGYYSHLEGAAEGAEPSVAPDSGLSLKAQMQGWDLHVTWNRNAPILREGEAHGVLTILDGRSRKRQIVLGKDELRSLNKVVYFPMSEQVQFQLEVLGASGKTTESILAILGSSSSYTAAPPLK